MNLSFFEFAYLATWLIACGVAFVLYVVQRHAYAISTHEYWQCLTEPWKLTTFAIATAALILIAPYSGDVTWDRIDATFMAILTFATASFAVGTLYQSLRGWRPLRQAFVAACAWIFSASWSYDLYLLLRDGTYPVTWAPNIGASSILYVCAGLVWSLEYQPGRGVVFAFQREDWPLRPRRTRFVKLWWVAAPFIVIVAVSLLSFLVRS